MKTYNKKFTHKNITFTITIILYFKVEKKMDGYITHSIGIVENGPQVTSYEKIYDVSVRSSDNDAVEKLQSAIDLAVSEAVAWVEDIPKNKTPEEILLADLGFEILSN